MAKSKKVGRFSKDEISFIKENRDSISPEDIAVKLGREPNSIRTYLGLGVGDSPSSVSEGARWEEIRQHFSAKEREFFREEYDRFQSQSEDEFLPAEESQLFQALTLGILVNRNLAKQKAIEDDINRIAGYRKKLEDKVLKADRELTENEMTLIRDYRDDIKGLKIDLNNVINQYTEFSKEKGSILKQLKMTRDQRVKELESGKETFVGLMRSFNKKEVREKEGRLMELLRLSVIKDIERLGKFDEYPDGSEGQPLLSIETVKKEEQGEEHENTIHKRVENSGEDKGSGEGQSNSKDSDSSKLVEDG